MTTELRTARDEGSQQNGWRERRFKEDGKKGKKEMYSLMEKQKISRRRHGVGKVDGTPSGSRSSRNNA